MPRLGGGRRSDETKPQPASGIAAHLPLRRVGRRLERCDRELEPAASVIDVELPDHALLTAVDPAIPRVCSGMQIPEPAEAFAAPHGDLVGHGQVDIARTPSTLGGRRRECLRRAIDV